MDFCIAAIAVLWMGEALVRLPAGFVVTGLIYAYFCARFVMTLPRLWPHVQLAWVVFVYPAVALLSVLWSQAPFVSLIGSVQMAFTLLIAVFVGAQFTLRQIAWIIALGLGVAMAGSAVNLFGVLPPTRSWEGGFLGIFTNKNALGQRAALLLLTLTFLIAEAGPRRFAAGLLAALTAGLLVMSKSATGIVLGFGFSILFAAMMLKDRGRPAATYLGVVSATIAAVVLVVVIGLRIDPIAWGLETLGKNHTLTGRTFLWEIGAERVRADPLLGYGYLAYWTAPAFAHETAVIAQAYGGTVTSFHNFLLEVAVMLGVPGVVAILAGLVWVAIGLGRCRAGLDRRWASAVFILLVGLSLIGSSLYRPHEITYFLIVALAVSARRATT